MAKRGGRRPGAGPKPKPPADRYRKFSITFPPDLADYLTSHPREQRSPLVAKSLRQSLLKAAPWYFLKADGVVVPQSGSGDRAAVLAAGRALVEVGAIVVLVAISAEGDELKIVVQEIEPGEQTG